MANTIISEEHTLLIIGLLKQGKHQEAIKEVDRLVVEYREQSVLDARENLAFLIQKNTITEDNADYAVRHVFKENPDQYGRLMEEYSDEPTKSRKTTKINSELGFCFR